MSTGQIRKVILFIIVLIALNGRQFVNFLFDEPVSVSAEDQRLILSQISQAVYEGKLTGNDPITDSGFGFGVGISGDTAVVSRISQSEAVYVFERNEGGINNWGQIKKLTSSDGQPNDEFGVSVTIEEDTIIVGADLNFGGPGSPGPQSGAVYIYERNAGGTNNWGEVKKLTPDTPMCCEFGLEVILKNNTLVVSAHEENFGGLTEPGAVYVFERNLGGPDNWGQVKRIIDPVPAELGKFGRGVDWDEDTLIVYSVSAPRVHIFDRNQGGENNWGWIQSKDWSNPQPGIFGSSVAVNNDRIIIPTIINSENYMTNLYSRNNGGPNNWGEIHTFSPSDTQANDYFGYSTSIFQDKVMIGATGNGGGVGNPFPLAGAVYIFQENAGGIENWGEILKLSSPEIQAGESFGVSLAYENNGLIIVGARYGDAAGPPAVIDSGAAYLFCLEDDLEENDEFPSATSIAPGSFSGLQICGGDDDYYSFTADPGETITVTTTFTHTHGNLELALYDSNQDQLAISQSSSDDEIIVYTALNGGTFFIKVFGESGALNQYSLDFTITPPKLTPTPTPSITPTPSSTPTMSPSPTATATATPTNTPSPTATVSGPNYWVRIPVILKGDDT